MEDLELGIKNVNFAVSSGLPGKKIIAAVAHKH